MNNAKNSHRLVTRDALSRHQEGIVSQADVGCLFFHTVATKTVAMDLIRAESEIMLNRADRALQHASTLPYDSVSRFLHTREALEHAVQAVAYGLNSAAAMVIVCRQELDECVDAQINCKGDNHG